MLPRTLSPVRGEGVDGTTETTVTGRWKSRTGRASVWAFLALAVAVQFAQGLDTKPSLNNFDRTYLLVSYESGFTRARPGRTTLRVGHRLDRDPRGMEIAQWLLTACLLALLVILVVMAMRTRRTGLEIAAIGVCCSPFVFDFVITQRHPDSFGFVVATAYAVGLLVWPRRRTGLAVVAGLAMAVAVAMHEAAALQPLPWILVIALLADQLQAEGDVANRRFRVAMLAIPGTLVALASAVFGRLDASDVASLERTATSHGFAGSGIFRNVGNDLETSIQQTLDLPLSVKLASVGATVVLLALAGWLLVGFQPNVRHVLVEAARRDRLVAASYVLVALGLITLHAIGLDWMRWLASFGLMATVAILFVSLAAVGGTTAAPPVDDLPPTTGQCVAVAAVSLYLLLLWPLAVTVDFTSARRLFVFMQP